MSDLPLDAQGRRPAFFDKDGVDQLVSVVLELATELWVVRERLFRVESAAADQGMPLRSLVETRALSPEEDAELAQMRAAMTENMFRVLKLDTRSMSPAEAQTHDG